MIRFNNGKVTVIFARSKMCALKSLLLWRYVKITNTNNRLAFSRKIFHIYSIFFSKFTYYVKFDFFLNNGEVTDHFSMTT